MSTSREGLRIVRRIDCNTRALVKVISAEEYLRDAMQEGMSISRFHALQQAVGYLQRSKHELLRDRRGLRLMLWEELNRQGADVRTQKGK